MIKTILLENQAVYQTGVLTVALNRQIPIKVPPEEAQRLVNEFVHLDISTQIHAEPPTLVIGQTSVWRVPLHLTFPSFGDVGGVGHLDVDPLTGALQILPQYIEDIMQNAENLALRFTSPTA